VAKLTFCRPAPPPKPELTRGELLLLLRAMAADGLLSPAEVSRVLRSSTLVSRETLSLETIESIAPAGTHLAVRWLRGFFVNGSKQSDEVMLSAVMPRVSSVLAFLQVLRGGVEGELVVEVPRNASLELVRAVNWACRELGANSIIVRSDEPAAPTRWTPPPALDLIAEALGSDADAARALLSEVFESGGL